MYFSLDHPDLLEGVLHCYFQSLGCRHQQCVAAELLARYCSPEEDDGDKEKKETTTSSSSADGAGRGDGTTSGATTDGATTTTTGVSRPLTYYFKMTILGRNVQCCGSIIIGFVNVNTTFR